MYNTNLIERLCILVARPILGAHYDIMTSYDKQLKFSYLLNI